MRDNSKTNTYIIIIILVTMFCQNYRINKLEDNLIRVVDIANDFLDVEIVNQETKLNELIVGEVGEEEKDTLFDYLYPRMKVFNKNIDSTTVKHIANVMHVYGLDSNEHQIEMYTGQILLESGAKQHRVNGELVVSSAGAIGMCQILPSTCLGYITQHVNGEDADLMYELGADDFEFVYTHHTNYGTKINRCKDWLSNVYNNIVMWGYITRNNINRKGDIYKQLVSYNMGTTNMNKYIDAGNEPEDHRYIKGIKSKIGVAEKGIVN